jgi:hypothetical protein
MATADSGIRCATLRPRPASLGSLGSPSVSSGLPATHGVANSKAWASAQTVRRAWLRTFLARKSAPKNNTAFWAPDSRTCPEPQTGMTFRGGSSQRCFILARPRLRTPARPLRSDDQMGDDRAHDPTTRTANGTLTRATLNGQSKHVLRHRFDLRALWCATAPGGRRSRCGSRFRCRGAWCGRRHAP